MHQVELDLQADELRESRAELESALHHRMTVYDHLPAACFTADQNLRVLEMNRAASAMFGLAQDDAGGLLLESLLAAGGGRALQKIVSRLAGGAAQATATLVLPPCGAQARRVNVTVGADPGGPGFLGVVTDAGEPCRCAATTA